MIIVTIFEIKMSKRKIVDMLLHDVELMQRYQIIEDECQKGIFTITDIDDLSEIYTLGVKNNAIWSPRFDSFIEDLLKRKNVSFSKKKCPFETVDEITILFFQKYLI